MTENPGYNLFTIKGVYGPSPFDLDIARPTTALTGVTCGGFAHTTVADPFYYSTVSGEHLLFEIYGMPKRRGQIAVAEGSPEAGWANPRIVLEEDFHLSYPHPIRECGYEGLIVVEAATTRQVRLYAQGATVDQWRFTAVILEGDQYNDPTPFRWCNYWYLFSCVGGPPFGRLELFVAPDLFGPWSPHPCSPVIDGNPVGARPAGPLFQWAGKLYRPGQDCSRRYGERVIFHEIDHLDPIRYQERPMASELGPGPQSWRRSGMHHIDFAALLPGRCSAVVDGYRRILGERPNHKL
jgi:hypothetical protein